MEEVINNNNPTNDIVALKKAEFTEKSTKIKEERVP